MILWSESTFIVNGEMRKTNNIMIATSSLTAHGIRICLCYAMKLSRDSSLADGNHNRRPDNGSWVKLSHQTESEQEVLPLFHMFSMQLG